MESEPLSLRINCDRILDTVAKSVRRASSFMALGIRASTDQNVTSIVPDGNFALNFMPLEIPRKEIQEIQGHFQNWVIGNSLRELNQATSIFTDQIFESCLLAAHHKKPIPDDFGKQTIAFKKKPTSRVNFVKFLRPLGSIQNIALICSA